MHLETGGVVLVNPLVVAYLRQKTDNPPTTFVHFGARRDDSIAVKGGLRETHECLKNAGKKEKAA